MARDTFVFKKMLINRAAVRRYVHDHAAKTHRGEAIQRVAAEFYDDLEGALRRRIQAAIQRHPSGYKTLLP